jgi:hypothetical protein
MAVVWEVLIVTLVGKRQSGWIPRRDLGAVLAGLRVQAACTAQGLVVDAASFFVRTWGCSGA